jgi:hypothetical protein
MFQYVVNALRKTAYERYEKNGTYIPEPELEVVEGGNKDGDNDSQEEREELMEVFYGCTGKIIGPKGAKIQEIKKTSGVTDIKMPAKSEDGPRPKARELVNVTIIGKGRAIATAKTLIQAVVDEWVCLVPPYTSRELHPNLYRPTLLVPLVMVAALSNPRAATIMARVTAALVEVVTTALVTTTPVVMEVELGTRMALAVVTTEVLLWHHGTRVRRPAVVTTVVLLRHRGTRVRRPVAAGKLQTFPKSLLLRRHRSSLFPGIVGFFPKRCFGLHCVWATMDMASFLVASL